MTNVSKDEITKFLLWFLEHIANEINESDHQPVLNKNTYEAINHFSCLMYKNDLCNYANLYSCLYTKHHYQFLTDTKQINETYPNRKKECDKSNSESRKKYTNIPTFFYFHDIVDFITKNDILFLSNELYSKQLLFDELKNDIEHKLSPPTSQT